MFRKIIQKIAGGFAWIALKFIDAYRLLISPFLGNCCRFYPSCSIYAKEAIKTYGVFKGGYLTCRRLLCCHPWHAGGFDPVPPQKIVKKPDTNGEILR